MGRPGWSEVLAYVSCDSGEVSILVDRSDWDGMVRGRNDDFSALYVVAPDAVGSGTSWGGPFRAVASDPRSWFVKSLQTCPPGQGSSLAVEQIVAQAGRLIGAPVCETSLIRVPAVLAGWTPRPGFPALEAGLAHASLALEHAEETRPYLAARAEDSNAVRHVGVYALYDWCMGWDPQWLLDLDGEKAVWSHDHGLYFPPAGRAGWAMEDLTGRADQECLLADPKDGLSAEETKRVAGALEQVTRPALAEVMCSVPASWPVTDTDLEDLGWFLEHRAPAVAARVRSLA